jgi:hypothetical protein
MICLNRIRIASSLMVCLAAIGSGALMADEKLETLHIPLSRVVHPVPEFELDVRDIAEDAAAVAWGKQAQSLCEEWFSVLCSHLATDEWKPPQKIRLVMKVPGYSTGHSITVSAKWINEHPDDFGLMIHELTHIIQNYPGGQPGWLVEGVADYVRYWKYEPEMPRRRIDTRTAKYTDAYYTSAAFLAWTAHQYDRRLLRRLDAALRKGEYKDELFETITGKPLDTLWDEFVKAQPQPRR